MKKFLIIFMLGIFAFSFSCFSQLEVDSSGDVTMNGSYWTGGLETGIVTYGSWTIPALFPSSANSGGLGTASKYFHEAHIHHMYCSNVIDWPSDRRAKENIIDIGSGLDKVKLLRPVRFDIKESFFANLTSEAKKQYRKMSTNRLGFIVQEVNEIVPEVIFPEPTTGYSGISTTGLIPLLVKAIQEQQEIIETLEERIEKLEPESKE